MKEEQLKQIINSYYSISVNRIEKNQESTVGNVYIAYSETKKFVFKIYDDVTHVESMILLHNDLSNDFNIPKIIKNKNNEGYVEITNFKYIVLYSFLEGVQIGKINKLSNNLIQNIALELRRLHDSTCNINKYNLKKSSFGESYLIKRKSLLHFDLTKGNIFYNKEKNSIGFIDFDDAKYGPAVFDISIIISLLFFSKTKGIDIESVNLFLDTYYNKDLELRNEETKYIKDIAIAWINYTLKSNDFNPSTNESFNIKKKLIEENLFIKNLIPLKNCINKDLYEMYQDIPKKELGSINNIKDASFNKFLNICENYIKEEININEEINTTTLRYILHINNLPVGEVGIRTTINDFWLNKGSQIYYKIRKSQRKKGYGNIILNLALKEAKKLGFKQVRINCDNKNIASKKIILNNGGKEDVVSYKTEEGYSTSYLINIKEK